MIDPQRLRELVMEASANIPAIKRREMVVTDDEFVTFLTSFKAADNQLLVVVLPTYTGFGEEDSAGANTIMQFFILEKLDYKSQTQEQYLAVFQRTLDSAKQFLTGIFANSGICGAETFSNDWTLQPVSNKAQCNGYEIQIDSAVFFDFL